MNAATPRFDAAFLERQHRKLSALRGALQGAQATRDSEQQGAQAAAGAQAREYEEDAQRLDLLDLDADLANRTAARLAQVERALQKLAEGTYGVSDASGEAIPIERLEAVPEALLTLAEQQAREPTG